VPVSVPLTLGYAQLRRLSTALSTAECVVSGPMSGFTLSKG
jgi:hypothetical protein